MRSARLTFYNGHFDFNFSILKKKNPDSLPTYWDFESHRLHKHFPENQKYSRAAL